MKRFFFTLFITIFFFTSHSFASSITPLDGDTLIDSENDLVWIATPLNARNWTAATSFASSLDRYRSTSWRLATKTELLSLVEDLETPKIDPLFKLGPVKNWTSWSSTEKTDASFVFSSRAYIVSFSDGSNTTAAKASAYAFLLTRDWDGFDYSLLDSTGAILMDSNGHYLLGAQ
jgi:hypothetical protein